MIKILKPHDRIYYNVGSVVFSSRIHKSLSSDSFTISLTKFRIVRARTPEHGSIAGVVMVSETRYFIDSEGCLSKSIHSLNNDLVFMNLIPDKDMSVGDILIHKLSIKGNIEAWVKSIAKFLTNNKRDYFSEIKPRLIRQITKLTARHNLRHKE